jgi:signal transduction histidine kinase/ActR/RegA family two-component response regulator/HAMP domain-containing protein
MIRPHKSSIKRKVTIVIMRASIAVLLVTVAAFMAYDLVTFRQTMVQNLATQARTIADNSTAAVAFGNRNDAANVLASLQANPHIVAAAIYDAQGALFVKYPVTISDADLPASPQAPGHQFGKSRLTIFQPVVQSGKPLGTLYLQSDLTALLQRFQLYGAISLMITAGSLLLAFWLSTMLQKRITNPIVALAATAQKISKEHNFSLRAPKLSDDELGSLTDAFNGMLERIQASDAALRESERRESERAGELAVVIEAVPVPVIIVHDADGRHMTGNRAAGDLVRIPGGGEISKSAPDDVKPKHFKSFKDGRELQPEELPAQRAARGESVKDFEFDLVFDDGTILNLLGYGTPLLDEQGHPRGAVHTLVDITARKRAETVLREAKESAETANRSKDDFLAALSHELRTPLNPVLLLASEAAEDAQLPAEVRAQFATIRNNVELEARLIDDLLDLTRITRGKLSLNQQTLDVHEVLKEAVNIVRADAAKKQITLTLDFRAGERNVFGDPVRLQQIFWNVLKNAVKFTPEAGKITVQTFAENDSIFIEITDTGIGMNAAELKRVFTAFAQGDHAESGSHRFGGLGLGLAISQKITELHSGVIQAASAGRDQGATFTIKLPLCAQADQKNDTASPTPSKNSEVPARGNRILLVEDHEPTRTALAHLLTRRNFDVLTAASVAEGRELAAKNKIDLLISDIGLPDGSGYALMSELQKLYGLNGIALSGYGMEEDVTQSQKAGFVAHLTKPVRIQSLDSALVIALTQLKQTATE